MVRTICLFALILLGCASESVDTSAQSGTQFEPSAEDLIPVSAGSKADGAPFDPNHLISDDLFEDAGYLTRAQIQGFLEATPYGRSSLLHDLEVDGKLTSQIIHEAATENGINPLVLLVKLQVESSVIARPDVSQWVIDRAMGCGCPDGASCDSGYRGLAGQIHCAARLFREYLNELDTLGRTRSGWAVDEGKDDLEGIRIFPRSRATAALYTYTPWVLSYTGGNWLFWNVHRRFSNHVLAQNPNHRWIGGPCESSQDTVQCGYAEAACLLAGPDSPGTCSRPCELACPDSDQPFTSTTFCVDLGTSLTGTPGGWCVSRCDTDVYPLVGCRDGFECVASERFGQPETVRNVCWPVRASEATETERPDPTR